VFGLRSDYLLLNRDPIIPPSALELLKGLLSLLGNLLLSLHGDGNDFFAKVFIFQSADNPLVQSIPVLDSVAD
jgi:hypothetical protein